MVGIFLLSLIARKYRKEDTGLYRDDGLAIIRSRSGRQADLYRKNLSKIMKDNGLKIEVKCNMKTVDYLDITFNLEDGSYKPYRKPNNSNRYVHVESNHPSNITKQIPKSISKRISANSCNGAVFNEAAPYYNSKLKECGYSEQIHYEEPVNTPVPNRNETASNETNAEVPHVKKRNRSRNIIWFNPPFCKSVETKVGRIFLKLVDQHFPRGHRYHKIFNRNTVKVSYSCMDNMESIIKQHNRNIMKKESEAQRQCDCRNEENCPLEGKCCTKNVVYSAVVKHTDRNRRIVSKTYIGLSEPEFKKRYRVHTHTFNNRITPNDTSLSKYVWGLKDEGITQYSVKWSILSRAYGYNKSSKTCGLCLTEKLLICDFLDKDKLINDRSELVSKCIHLNKHLLKNCKPG